MILRRDSPIPLHLQLKTALAAQIAQGNLSLGQRLPSERQLCEMFRVSRTTVRRAIEELERAHLIRTVPAQGTFVVAPQVRVAVHVSLAGFSSDIQRAGLSPSSILLEAALLSQPPEEIADPMRIPPDEEIIKVERLRLVNDIPLAIHTCYLPHRLCPGILEYDLSKESLFGLLRGKYGLHIAYAQEQVRACLADEREAKLLRLTPPAAVLRAQRLTFLDNGEVIEYSFSSYCGEWYHLTMVLEGQETR
ncbi:MAG: GntR family transcriptional regulator [Anaerolineae bacterium]